MRTGAYIQWTHSQYKTSISGSGNIYEWGQQVCNCKYIKKYAVRLYLLKIAETPYLAYLNYKVVETKPEKLHHHAEGEKRPEGKVVV